VSQSSNIKISRAVKQAARWQLIAIVLVAIASLLIVGIHAAVSVLVGGFAVLVGSFIGGHFTQGSVGQDAGSVLVILLKAEAIKVLVIVVLLFATFKWYAGLVPLALICGLAVSALVSGAGLRVINDDEKLISRD
jgi:ATP synthase protein I